MIETWDTKLKEQVQREFKNYALLLIQLDAAQENRIYPLPGDCLYVNKVSSNSATATIRLNRSTNEPIELKYQTKIKTVFTSFFVSNEARAGEWLELLIGINFDIENVPVNRQTAQPVIKQVGTLANTDYQVSAFVCNTAEIKSSPENIGLVWVDFGQAAVQDDCRPLEPGESLTVSISNTNQIHANFENAGEVIFIILEV